MSQERQRSTEEEVDRFLDLVNRSGFWQSIDLRILCDRDGRQWINLITRGFLDHRAARSVPRFSQVHRPDFRAWQVVLPIAGLPGVVRGIASGTAKLRPQPVRYIGRSSQPATTSDTLSVSWPARIRVPSTMPGAVTALVDHGSSMWDVVRHAGHDPWELDSMIRSGPNAYDGLSDLVRRFCGRPGGLDVRGNTTAIELIAPLAVRFDREKVASSPGRVTVALRAAADAFVGKAELQWTAGIAGEPLRHGFAKLSEREWEHEGGTLRSQLDIPIREGDATVTLFILIGDRCVDCVSVPLAGSNPRMRAHNALDPSGPQFVEKLRRRMAQCEGVRDRRWSAALLPRLPGGAPMRAEGLGNAVITSLMTRVLPSSWPSSARSGHQTGAESWAS